MSYIPLSYTDLLLASLLLLINGLLSVIFSLGLLRRLVIAVIRMVVQLLLVGSILSWLFAASSLFWTSLAALVMVSFAGYEIVVRQDHPLKGFWSLSLGAGSMTIASLMIVLLALTTQIRPDPWYHPQYMIPILGMILGNTMTGVSLGLNTLTNAVRREADAIEAGLILGQTRHKAMQGVIRQALRNGLMPLINAMSVMGLVSLPGMMTGQILAGAAPQDAVKYQILIMFLIGGSTGFGVIISVLGASLRLSDNRHRLRLDRLENKEKT